MKVDEHAIRPPSSVNHAAIYQRSLAGHVIRIRSGQERDKCGYIFRRLRPAQSNATDKCFVACPDFRAGNFSHAPVDLDPHIRPDHAGTIGVDRDAIVRELFRRRLRQGAHRKFRCRIHSQHREAFVTGNGRCADDFAFLFAFLEFFRRCLNTPQNAGDIHFENLVEFLWRYIGQRLNLCDARVVDHDVEAAQFLFSVLNGGENLIAL